MFNPEKTYQELEIIFQPCKGDIEWVSMYFDTLFNVPTMHNVSALGYAAENKLIFWTSATLEEVEEVIRQNTQSWDLDWEESHKGIGFLIKGIECNGCYMYRQRV